MDTGEDKPDDAPAYAGLNDFDAYRTQQQAWLAKAIEDLQFKAPDIALPYCTSR